MESENITEQERELVDKLLLIREDYKQTKEQLRLSKRKDLLVIELKDLLENESTYYGLKNALEDYIRELEEEMNGSTKR